jgi:hypothetical protein
MPNTETISSENVFPRLLEVLELDAAAAPDTIISNAETLAQAARDTRSAQTESARFYRLATDADAARQAAERRAEEERAGRIEAMLDVAELRGRIPPAERGNWREQLQSDFANAQIALANARVADVKKTSRLPASGATPLTARLATRRLDATRHGNTDSFLTLVNERMTRTGESYATAFARAKREHAGLFKS